MCLDIPSFMCAFRHPGVYTFRHTYLHSVILKYILPSVYAFRYPYMHSAIHKCIPPTLNAFRYFYIYSLTPYMYSYIHLNFVIFIRI